MSWRTGSVCERCGFDALRNMRGSARSYDLLLWWGAKKGFRRQGRMRVPSLSFGSGLLPVVSHLCYHCIEVHMLQIVNRIGWLAWSHSLKIKKRLSLFRFDFQALCLPAGEQGPQKALFMLSWSMVWFCECCGLTETRTEKIKKNHFWSSQKSNICFLSSTSCP